MGGRFVLEFVIALLERIAMPGPSSVIRSSLDTVDEMFPCLIEAGRRFWLLEIGNPYAGQFRAPDEFTALLASRLSHHPSIEPDQVRTEITKAQLETDDELRKIAVPTFLSREFDRYAACIFRMNLLTAVGDLSCGLRSIPLVRRVNAVVEARRRLVTLESEIRKQFETRIRQWHDGEPTDDSCFLMVKLRDEINETGLACDLVEHTCENAKNYSIRLARRLSLMRLDDDDCFSHRFVSKYASLEFRHRLLADLTRATAPNLRFR